MLHIYFNNNNNIYIYRGIQGGIGIGGLGVRVNVGVVRNTVTSVTLTPLCSISGKSGQKWQEIGGWVKKT